MTQRSSGVAGVLRRASLVFWDFDGVIKESVSVKADAFERLFLAYGPDVSSQVRRHHERHSGISRYDKIPLYLRWAGEPASAEQVERFCARFASLVRQAVIDAPWVPGVREYLEAQHHCQCFVLLTATPLDEIRHILRASDLDGCFHDVRGAPEPKAAAIRDVLSRSHCRPEDALVVGDSEADLAAADSNHVAFVLRQTSLNQDLQKRFEGPAFHHLEMTAALDGGQSR